MNNRAVFMPAWNKYLPAIRILLKKSATGEQVLTMSRIDFDKVAGVRKSGYRFIINYVNNRTDSLFSGNSFAQSFIDVLQNDEPVQEQLSRNDYTFTFTSKYQLQIKNNGLNANAATPAITEKEILPDSDPVFTATEL